MEMPVPNADILSRRDRIVARLTEILGEDGVIWAPEEVKAYECDALTAYRCPPLAAAGRRRLPPASAATSCY